MLTLKLFKDAEEATANGIEVKGATVVMRDKMPNEFSDLHLWISRLRRRDKGTIEYVRTGGYVDVKFGAGLAKRYHMTQLAVIVEKNPFTKKLSMPVATIEDIQEFLRQAALEGAPRNTRLRHGIIELSIDLPLSPRPQEPDEDEDDDIGEDAVPSTLSPRRIADNPQA